MMLVVVERPRVLFRDQLEGLGAGLAVSVGYAGGGRQPLVIISCLHLVHLMMSQANTNKSGGNLWNFKSLSPSAACGGLVCDNMKKKHQSLTPYCRCPGV